MDFVSAIKSGFTNYVNFSGRARRSEFWFWILFTFIASIVASIVDFALGSPGIIPPLVSLALLLPTLAVGARRLHDTNRSGWWLLIYLTVIGIIVLIVFWVLDSEPDNQHGPNPKGAGGRFAEQPPPPAPPAPPTA